MGLTEPVAGLLAGIRRLGVALVVLCSLSVPATALDPKDRAAVRQAFDAASRDEWERAFAILESVSDALAWKALRWSRMMADEGPEDFADIARFMLANPHWPSQRQMQVLAENKIRDPADHALIRRFFAGRPPLTTRGHIRYAEALFDAGEVERARALIRLAWVEGDFSRSEGAKFPRLYGRLLTPQDHIDRLHNLLWDYRRRSVAQMLKKVPDGQRRLAQARLRLQRRQAGVDRAIRAVPGALRNDPGLVFDRLRWRRQKRRHDGAIEILLDPPAEVGRPGMWWFEREYQIRRALRARKFDLAYRLASRHGQTEGESFAEAEWLAGWLALRFTDQPRRALRHFETLHQGVARPVSVARAAYWAGRAASALDDDEAAAAWYRQAAGHGTAFYGQLAALELGKTPRMTLVLPATAAHHAAFESKELVRVARVLLEAGVEEHLVPFLIRLAGDASDSVEVELIGALAAESGLPHLVTIVGKYAAYGGVMNEAVAFPVPDLDPLIRPPRGYPDPALVLAIARQESMFSSWVISRAGARGMLQLMPRTASLMAADLDLPYNAGLLTGDPAYNVRLGSHYLKTLLERYREPGLALAAYNAGPRRVEQWMRLHGDPRRGDRHTMIDWLELIPFDETRNYVQRVLENYGVYRLRLNQWPTLVAMRSINGPLDPVPRPVGKPSDRSTSPARTVAGPGDPPPRPRLKPSWEHVLPASLQSAPIPSLKPASRVASQLPAASVRGLLVQTRLPELKPRLQL